MTAASKETGRLRIVDDSFDGYTASVARDGRQIHHRSIQGVLIRVTATATATAIRWETVYSGQVIGWDIALVGIHVQRAVVKSVNGRRMETRVIAPGQPFPNVDRMNEAAPLSEWSEGVNGLRGPWQKRQSVTMLDPVTMDVYTFQTTDIDGFVAIRQLVDKVKAMRTFRNEMLSPVVRLGDVLVKMRGVDCRRPFFHIVGWIGLGGGDPEPAVPPAPVIAGGYEMEAPDPAEDGPEELSF